MRLFVAVELSPAVRDALGAVIATWRSRAALLAPGAKITWTAPERAHLTIRFIGETPPDVEARIRAALEPPVALRPFDVRLSGAGVFPPGGPPRVLWVGVSEGRESLMRLEREVTARLEQAGAPTGDDRAYSPHLTLARVRHPAGLRASRLLEGLRDVSIGTIRVEAITLFESRLSPEGATYVPLLVTRLVDPAGRTGREEEG